MTGKPSFGLSERESDPSLAPLITQLARAVAERDDRALPLLPPAQIVQPAFIEVIPVGILVQDNLAPDDNWAQVEFKATGGFDIAGVGFFYIWTNPTQDTIGLSVDNLMGLIGFCSAKAKRGFTGGWSASVYSSTPGSRTCSGRRAPRSSF